MAVFPFSDDNLMWIWSSQFLSSLIHFKQTVDKIYPKETQLNKTNTANTAAPFLSLNVSISNDITSPIIYDKQVVFDFDTVNSLILIL